MPNFKTIPYEHQLYEFEKYAESQARALIWQMRTGKTKAIIDMACHLYIRHKINSVLVFAPNGVHENWLQRELPIHHWDIVNRYSIHWHTGTAGNTLPVSHIEEYKEKHELWWAKASAMLKTTKSLTWFSFNSESMTRLEVRKLVKYIINKRQVLVVFDESHDFRAPGSKRTKMARALVKKCRYKRILTGTPVTNSPLHAFAQFELLQQQALGFKRYEDFKNHYARYVIGRTKSGRHYPLLAEYTNLEELKIHIAEWSSILLRKDCIDLPDLIKRTRNVKLTTEQYKIYEELHTKFTFDIGTDEISIGENTSILTKLQQVVSGFIIDEFKQVYDIPGGNPRLEAVSNEVYLSSGKVIVWCRFREDMDRVAKRLATDGHRVVQYHGRTSTSSKRKVRELFAPSADNDIKVLVGYPVLGLDLSAASTIIWYSHTFDAILREQADERATVFGGSNVSIIDLVAPGVDQYILDNVLNKISIAETLTEPSMNKMLRSTKL